MIKKQPIDTIGSREMVDFPSLGLKNIPAKIDTGADSSAIWVSDIEQHSDDELSFVMFAPGNRYYSGERINVTSYKTATVKNSSGVSELRYKVRLVICVKGRTIKAWFNLADRSGMNYSVLLGRRLLKNKFLVDVSQTVVEQPNVSGNKQVLVFISKPKDIDGLNKFYKNLFGDNVEAVVSSYSDLEFWIKKAEVVVKETITNRDLSTFDLVYFKSHRSARELASATAQYLQSNGVKYVGKEVLPMASYDKLTTYMYLALHGIDIPPTFSGSLPEIKRRFNILNEEFGSPFVVKEINSERGKNNYLISSEHELDEIIKRSAPGDIYILQQYIENDGYVRACVFGDQAAPVIYRHPVLNQDPLKRHLNQPKGGANAEILDESHPDWQDIQTLAVRCAELMNRQIAGVDLMKDTNTGKWLVLEVNIEPQLKSGSFTSEKLKALAEFIDNELNQ